MSETSPVRLRRAADRRVAPSPLQERVRAADRLLPDDPISNMAHRYRMRTAIDPDRFADAVARVVSHCDVLRMIVDPADGSAWVVDRPPVTTEVLQLDADDADDWSNDRVSRPLDATATVYDSALLRHGDEDWSWWMCVNHVATDATSAGLVASAVFAVYDDPGLDLAERIDGAFFDADVIEAARSTPQSDAPAAQPPLAWYGPTGERTSEVLRHELDVPGSVRPGIAALLDGEFRSLSRDLSLLAVAASACAVIAHRVEGRSVFDVGVPLHHRGTRRTRRLVGPLMEIHPLRVHVDADDTFRTLHERTLRAIMDLLRSATLGSAPERTADIVINVIRRAELKVAGVEVEDHWVRPARIEPSTMFRLHLVDVPDRDGGRRLDVELDENAALRPDAVGAGPADHLTRVFESVVADPDVAIRSIDITTADEVAHHRALSPSPDPIEVTDVVPAAIARRLVDAGALVVAEQDGLEISGDEFDRWVDALACRLRDDGVVAGRRVGLRLERHVGVLIAITAVHRLGASFVMLSPGDPDERIEAIRTDADLVAVLGPNDVVRSAGGDGSYTAASVETWSRALTVDDEAYVLYTSGSTGAPKGVPISHRGLADYMAFAVREYTTPDRPAPVVALHSELIFDLTITSLFLGLITGGRTVVFTGTPIEALAAVAHDDRIDFLKATPSQLELFLRLAPDGVRPLRCIVVGGEAFRRPLAERMVASCEPGVVIVNEYGPTEAVVGCMIHRWDPALDAGADVPVGVASAGSQLLVLDHDGRLAPIGAWGELWVRRPGMAQEYLGLPELTSERFVHLQSELVEQVIPTSANHGGRWYRTGDRVRVERAGVLVYGGRDDDQLKVRGIRLEPGEVESALVEHPSIEQAHVRVWNPTKVAPPAASRRCVRCGLGTDVPGTTLTDGVCNVCIDYERVAPQADIWFRTEADLDAELAEVQASHDGPIDALHLLSGGKDSTYALYQLVQRGWRVHALTLDNGFISEGAKENVRRSIADLGITHEFATTEAMNEIFRDSLDRYANVCQGCYKTIYTLAVARARQMGIPVIVTGLSRGQFFETRLIPHQFEAGRFDPDAIDRTVLEARRVYHDTDDAVTRLLPEQAVFDEPDVFDRVRFLDFYRYVDVDLAELYSFLDERAPWVRPDDTGRSTNCLINIAGIHVHRSERGYHNYAEPYSWDVRLGHKTRDEALEELDDPFDQSEVDEMLAEVAYTPKPVELLTAWYRSADGTDVAPEVLREHLRARLPDHAIPAAFVRIDDVELASGTKADLSALPTPVRVARSSTDLVEPTTDLEERLCRIWRDELQVERVGATDDFFDLGGASLAALSVVAAIDAEFGTDLPDAAVFRARTVRALAELVERHRRLGDEHPIERLVPDAPPPRSEAEEAMLFEYRSDPFDPRYNVTRLYTLRPDGNTSLDRSRLVESVRDVVMLHEPLHVTHAADRQPLGADDCIAVTDVGEITADAMGALAGRAKGMPFDLDHGPLVRVHHGVSPTGEVFLLIGIHHIAVDAVTFDEFWSQVARRHAGAEVQRPAVRYGEHAAWQRARLEDTFADDEAYWLDRAMRRPDAQSLPIARPVPPEPDGYLRREVDIDPVRFAGGGATAFSRSMAAVAITVSEVLGRGAVEFGVSTSTNDHSATAQSVGYFLNTLPVVIDGGHDRTVGDVVSSAAAAMPDLIAHRRRPLARIVREARAAGLPEPSIDVVLAFQELATPTLAGAEVEQRILWSGASVFDCTFFVQERTDRIEIGLEHRGSVVGAADAARLLDLFEEALWVTVERSHDSVADAVDREVEADLVGAELDLTSKSPIPQQILDALTGDLDSVAVVDEHGELSAGALLVAVDDLATRIAEQMTDVGAHVAVSLERSASVVVAMLATWFARGTYVPVDPNVPLRRRERILDAAEPAVQLFDEGNADAGHIVVERPVSDVSADRVAAAVERLGDRAGQVSSDDTAYVIFTSGSTGAPKGVAVSHGNLAASTAARRGVYPHAARRFLVTSSIGFDSSLVGLVWPLTTGGAVVMPTDDVVGDVDRLADTIAATRTSHVLTVPSLYRALLGRRPARLVGLDTVIVAGEATDQSLVDEHHRILPGTALVDEYGPTEATIWCAAGEHVAGRRPNIGGPIPGVRLRVVGEDLRPAALGVSGELLVSGPTVTAGYLGDREATDARFVVLDGSRWYRTGDRVRVVHVEGARVLRFIGRVDDQLNVGGNRLEPAEVEHALTSLDGVAEAAVVAAGDPVRVIGHVVASDFDEASVRRELADELPARSIPQRFVVHDDLPRTAHGKVDRRALLSRRPAAETADVVDSASLGEADAASDADVVVAVWRDALARDDIDADTDFFDAGGDSLTAVVIVSDLGDRLGREVPIGDLIVGLTPRGMAERLGLSELAPASSDGTDVSDRRPIDDSTRGVELLRLRSAPAGAPLVVLTPAWDDVFGYQALANAFPDGTEVLALAIDPTIDEPDARTVAGFARRAHMLLESSVTGRSAVAVAGWSIGGLGAVELAKRLGASPEGERPPLLALIDTIYPGEDLHLWANRWSKYRSMVRPGGGAAIVREAVVTLRRRLGGPLRSLGLRLVRLSGVEADIRPTGGAARSVGVPEGLISSYVVDPIDSPVLLISADTTNPKRTRRRWEPQATRFAEVVVEGRHRGFDSIMHEGRVEAVAEAIAQRLDGAG